VGSGEHQTPKVTVMSKEFVVRSLLFLYSELLTPNFDKKGGEGLKFIAHSP
jgi:hypothetical protein